MKTISLFLIALTVNSALCADQYKKYFLNDQEWGNMCAEAGFSYNVSPRAIRTIGKIESGGNIYAYNPANKNNTADMGVMQINSTWIPSLRKAGLYDLNRLYEPRYNIHVGAWILRQCIDKFGQSWKSIDCYNKGAGKAQDDSAYINKYKAAYSSI